MSSADSWRVAVYYAFPVVLAFGVIGCGEGGKAEKPILWNPEIVLPAVLKRVEPVYPEIARRAGVGGKVVLQVVVQTNGDVGECKVVSTPDPVFNNPVIAAVKQWKYQPAVHDGRPIAVYFPVTVDFDPSRRPPPAPADEGVDGGVVGDVPGGVVGGAGDEPILPTGDVVLPVIIKKVDPTYPDVARRTGAGGKVIIQLVVQTNGDVGECAVLQTSDLMFEDPAIAAVRQWKYRPALKDGRPVAIYFTVRVDFDPSNATGPSGAPLTIEVFNDMRRDVCQRWVNTLDTATIGYRNRIHFIYREFPVPFYPQNIRAAAAARCAAEQGFSPLAWWSGTTAENITDGALFARAVRAKLPDIQSFETCFSSSRFDVQIQADIEEGKRRGVTATPTTFINGVRLIGERSSEELMTAISKALRERGEASKPSRQRAEFQAREASPPTEPSRQGAELQAREANPVTQPSKQESGRQGGDSQLNAKRDAEVNTAAPILPTSEVIPPTVLTKVPPVYPEIAGRARIGGKVILQVVIQTNGDVGECEVLKSSSSLLTDSAITAVKQWKYRPALQDGRPVAVYSTVTFNFNLPALSPPVAASQPQATPREEVRQEQVEEPVRARDTYRDDSRTDDEPGGMAGMLGAALKGAVQGYVDGKTKAAQRSTTEPRRPSAPDSPSAAAPPNEQPLVNHCVEFTRDANSIVAGHLMNKCPFKIVVRWSDEGGCRNWGCTEWPGPGGRVGVSSLKGHVQYAACRYPQGPVPHENPRACR